MSGERRAKWAYALGLEARRGETCGMCLADKSEVDEWEKRTARVSGTVWWTY